MQRQKMRHLRVTNPDGSISNRGGATVSGMIDENGNVVRYSIAWCHNKDNFNRHHGRVTATGRMNGGNAATGEGSWEELVDSVQREVNAISRSYHIEQRNKLIAKADRIRRKVRMIEQYI